jgi:hypothetical protein
MALACLTFQKDCTTLVRTEESSNRLNYKLKMLELIMGKHHHSGKSRIISEPEIVTAPVLVKKLIHELWYILNFSTQ